MNDITYQQLLSDRGKEVVYFASIDGNRPTYYTADELLTILEEGICISQN